MKNKILNIKGFLIIFLVTITLISILKFTSNDKVMQEENTEVFLVETKKIILQKKKTNYANNIYWVFGILLKKSNSISRDNVMKKLLKSKIDTRPFFLSMNKQKIFKKLKIFRNIKMPNSEFLSKNGFYLPSGLGIKNDEIKFISKKLLQILG